MELHISKQGMKDNIQFSALDLNIENGYGPERRGRYHMLVNHGLNGPFILPLSRDG